MQIPIPIQHDRPSRFPTLHASNSRYHARSYTHNTNTQGAKKNYVYVSPFLLKWLVSLRVSDSTPRFPLSTSHSHVSTCFPRPGWASKVVSRRAEKA